MSQRRGLGKGKGMGYKNLIPTYDSNRHRLNAMGQRMPQRMSAYGGKIMPHNHGQRIAIFKKKSELRDINEYIEVPADVYSDQDLADWAKKVERKNQGYSWTGSMTSASITNKGGKYAERGQKLFNLPKGYKAEAHWEKTRNGFRHVVNLYDKDGNFIDDASVSYQNRTWESYEYQTAIQKLLDKTKILSEAEKVAFIKKGELEEEKRVDREFGTIANVAALGEVFGKTEEEKNKWKTRMLKAGLEKKGLQFPENWESLPEAEKKKRLDAVIGQMKGGKCSPSDLKYGTAPDSQFDAKELRKGIKVELEHTNSRKVAKAIAKAHLKESGNYYKKLAKLEKKLGGKGKLNDKIDTLKFKSHVVSATAYGVREDYGQRQQEMTLREGHNNLYIEWEIFDEKGEMIDYAEIGIWTAGKKVTEYDGVMDIPKQAIHLLKKNGYNTTEIEG